MAEPKVKIEHVKTAEGFKVPDLPLSKRRRRASSVSEAVPLPPPEEVVLVDEEEVVKVEEKEQKSEPELILVDDDEDPFGGAVPDYDVHEPVNKDEYVRSSMLDYLDIVNDVSKIVMVGGAIVFLLTSIH